MSTITAKRSSFARKSKKSVGTYPFYIPTDSFGGPEIKTRKKKENRK